MADHAHPGTLYGSCSSASLYTNDCQGSAAAAGAGSWAALQLAAPHNLALGPRLSSATIYTRSPISEVGYSAESDDSSY